MDPIAQVGRPAPLFSLPDTQGNVHNLQDWAGKIVVLNFWSPECPWVERVDLALQQAQAAWGDRVVICPVASNLNESFKSIHEVSIARGLPFVLIDGQQQAADAYGALTTPHLFVVDAAGLLRYRGALDDVTFRQRVPTRFYLQSAVDALLRGKTPEPCETAAYGCALVRDT